MWKLTQGYLWYTRKHQKTSPWCNSRLRFMEYFLNSLEVSLYFSKERQWFDCMSTSIGHAKCHELCSVSFWFGVMRVVWQNEWLLNLHCAPHPRPSPLPTNQPDEMMMYHDKSFQFSSLLRLSLSLSANIKLLSTGSSQFSPLCYVSAKSKI